MWSDSHTPQHEHNHKTHTRSAPRRATHDALMRLLIAVMLQSWGSDKAAECINKKDLAVMIENESVTVLGVSSHRHLLPPVHSSH